MAGQELLGRGTMIANLDAIAARWRELIDSWDDAQRGRSESSHAQLFWSDLLRCFGVIPERVSLFEVEADRATTGRWGSIDVFWSGVFLGEAKSVGKNLDHAYSQALDYLAGGSIAQHEWPKYVIVTDFERLRVVKQAGDKWDITFGLDDLSAHVDQLTFLAGHEDVSPDEEADASIDAAAIMARLYEAMTGIDADDPVADDAATDPGEEDARVEQASVFLTRVLFLLYGDDAGLWREDLFYEFVLNYTRRDGTDLGSQLHQLFDTLNTPENKRNPRLPDMLARFPYVNGKVFEGDNPLEYFDRPMREALLNACRFRWTRISPAVFGSMFQLVKSKQARRAAGEHYTSETNILKTIGPLFLDDLREEANRLCANKSTTVKALRAFRDQLATHVFVDPACGCGNFLVIAYRDLRRIETQIIREIRVREGLEGMTSWDATLETKLTIGQFHGIEIHWWPAKIAETAMFLVDHQANRELAKAIGQAPERLPITITAHIHHKNALQSDWGTLIPAATGETYMFGNPPFLGDHTRTDEQLAELRAAWGPKKTLSRLDYVTAWHAKALGIFAGRTAEWAFVTTNSISQGDQAARLFEPIFEAGWRIKFAHRTFAWDSEAPGKAAVHCVIVGFTRDRAGKPRLFDYPNVQGTPVEVEVHEQINAYLVDGPNVLIDKRSTPLSPALPPLMYGSKPTDDGNFIITGEEHKKLADDPILAKYLRPYVGAQELLNGRHRWCLWLADVDPSDLSRSPELARRVEAVKAFRAKSKAASTREYPHHHLFRQFGLVTDDRFIALPEVSSERRRYLPIGYLEPEAIISNKVYGAPDDGGLLFGLGSSSMFITWMKAIGGRMKSDLSLSSTITWNNFPVPDLDDNTRHRIVKAGQGVLDARALHPERSLAEHYNPLAMDPALVKAHDGLDREVDRSFGAPRKLANERQRLELLFQNYQALTTARS